MKTNKQVLPEADGWTKRMLRNILIAGLIPAATSCGDVRSGSDVADGPLPEPSFSVGGPLYSGMSTLVGIRDGIRPHTVTSSNPAVISVPSSPVFHGLDIVPNTVLSETSITLTAYGKDGKSSAITVSVKPNVVNGNLTVRGYSPDAPAGCSDAGAVCAGKFGTVNVTLTDNGLPLKNRSVKFDVDQGPFQIAAGVDASALTSTITVVTNDMGVATAAIRVNDFAGLQVSSLKVTDVQSGALRIGTFIIKPVALEHAAAVTSDVLVIGSNKDQCPPGGVDFLIYGGTPPYSTASTSPSIVTLSPNTSSTESMPARFAATYAAMLCGSEGKVVDLAIRDGAGVTTTAKLTIKPGVEPSDAVPALVVVPAAVTLTCNSQVQLIASTLPTAATIAVSIRTLATPSSALIATVADKRITLTRAKSGSVATPAIALVTAGGANPVEITIDTPATCP